MTFYQKLETLCKERGITVTSLATELGFSSSAGTTWKKLKEMPRNSTLKKIADYFDISVNELEDGIVAPINYDDIDISSFRLDLYDHFLDIYKGDVNSAIKAYLDFEKTEAGDAAKDSGNYIHNNQNEIYNEYDSVNKINGSQKKLTEQEIALLRIFEKLDVIKQAQLLAFAADLVKQENLF